MHAILEPGSLGFRVFQRSVVEALLWFRHFLRWPLPLDRATLVPVLMLHGTNEEVAGRQYSLRVFRGLRMILG
jgi:hypothetical protein